MIFKSHLLVLFVILLDVHCSSAQSLKVISYNIHHGADKNEVNTLEEMGEYIKVSNADLVGLQEVDSMCNRSGSVDQMKILAEITGMHYAFQRHFEYDGGAYGLGILSKYPIISEEHNQITSIKNGENRSLALLSAKISLPDRKEIVFATVHLALDQSTRLIQADETLEFLESDLPLILTGDFNSEPGTEEIELFSEQMKMADDKLDYTFPVINPSKKIDYIWISKDHSKNISHVKVPLTIQYSDHLPLEAELTLKSN
ncbi:endonuclease/exonuclease/phosphatase family protein [Algoriphagus sp. D3-2-R+10]|uniref:endonuclease/exonuclease/phosphatase family protein n=1 Tax=Algoriphagus aurantiacus TaxID=3103948 RepID=UPI002B3E3461|nr:endonuclease/exonuclease/phosphatase family protein [Algoriphagus sp. D3-2-R+10]MEB2775384.1 endonuclease/exonuclease/phosphatase family protein [Algoriphagus sp. D3-2-R+10]